MVELEFSFIHDFEHDERTWAAFMDEFGAQQDVKVHLRRMTWDTAWAELFSFTSLHRGPHVSHIGNTWVSSLARMNSLRPFKPEDITDIAGESEFIAANWHTGTLLGDKRIWAIPWTGWIYVICYRKDLLEKIGIDPATAFSTAKSVRETIQRLGNAPLDEPWLNPRLPVAFRDLLHIASSWIWAAGGDLVDPQGTRILFNSAKAIEGLKDWLETYRAVQEPYRKLSLQETLDMFGGGRASAVLANIHEANTLLAMRDNPRVSDNLGVASVTDVPWTGGGSLVIWDHVAGNLQQERAALALVKFLASKEISLRYHRETGSMPSRIDALTEIYPVGNPAHDAIFLTATQGRGYHNVPIWRRIEYQLSEELGAVVRESLANPSADLVVILHAHLDALAARLNVTLGT